MLSCDSFLPMSGLLITIEGIEGAGKTSLIDGLKEFLLSNGKEVVCTREPGGTELGKKIRSLLLDSPETPAELTEVLLFAADRAEHCKQTLTPALKQGKVVICDRFIHSTLAYQGYGRGLDLKTLDQINNIATDGLKPNIVFLLDLEPEEGLKRAAKREDDLETSSESGWNRFEDEKLEFHRKIREGFITLANKTPESFVVLDASQSKEDVLRSALEELKKVLNQK